MQTFFETLVWCFKKLYSISFSNSAQSCPALCNPMGSSLPDSSVHGIFQAKILEGVAISYSKGSSQPRDRTHVSCVSCIGRQIPYHWATSEAQHSSSGIEKLQCKRPKFDPLVGKTPGRTERQPTPVFCMKNSMDRGAWWATIHGVTKNQTLLRD